MLSTRRRKSIVSSVKFDVCRCRLCFSSSLVVSKHRLKITPAVWDNVYGLDMSVIKEIAITEPLVDVVEGKAVVSNTVPILNLDLLTCTKEDCDFESEFLLKCIRNDFCHAFVAYFDCAFTQVHKPI